MAGVQATHNPCLHKFCIVIGDEEAVLLYRDEGDYTWDAYHTEVPHSQRGKGLGAILAQALFAHASNNNIKLRLSCTYLRHYVTKHPELNKLCVS